MWLLVKALIILIIVVSFTSCSETIDIKGFDSNLWKKDTCACNGYRNSIWEILNTNRDKILGMDDEQVYSYFGKPEFYDKSNGKYIFSYILVPTNVLCDKNLLSGMDRILTSEGTKLSLEQKDSLLQSFKKEKPEEKYFSITIENHKVSEVSLYMQ